MPSDRLDRRLSDLDLARYRFGRHEAARVLKLLTSLAAARFSAPAELIRFHEALMFLRAFPHSPSILRKTESLLTHFHRKVEALRESGADMDAFDTFEVSGIAGTTMEDTLSFDVARWLVERMSNRRMPNQRLPGRVEIAWDHYEPGRELGTTGPRFMPLLEDDSYVEADTPWRRWLETAAGKKQATAAWIIQRVADLPLPPIQKAELYESLRVPLRWDLGNSRVSRTRNWFTADPRTRNLSSHSNFPNLSSRATRKERSDRGESSDPVFPGQRPVFYHSGPLIPRSKCRSPRN